MMDTIILDMLSQGLHTDFVLWDQSACVWEGWADVTKMFSYKVKEHVQAWTG